MQANRASCKIPLILPDLQVGVKASQISETISMVSQPHVIWQLALLQGISIQMALDVKPLKWLLLFANHYPDLKVGENERILQEAIQLEL
jgi:hypothetical protein